LERTGFATLPLHHGRAPKWLVSRMINLARQIVTVIVDEFGKDEFLRRISDSYWFQALGCVLGYDWHSSGVTTVLTGVLRNAVTPEEHGLAVCGGKGRASRRTPSEIEQVGERMGLSTSSINRLRYISRMSAKIDNTAIQAGYPLYHHAMILSEDGKWAVVQQGLNAEDRTARRYHWLSEHVKALVVEPHSSIVGDLRRGVVLDMTARHSEACRKTSVDIVKDNPRKLRRIFRSIKPLHQSSLSEWVPMKGRSLIPEYLHMPSRINWKAVKRLYDLQPKNYEELLSVKGVGQATVRGLALISELIYGDKPSWKDPVKYSFAYGGKDGVPFPVDREAMDKSIEILEVAVRNAKIGDKDRLRSIERLRRHISEWRLK